MLRCIHCHQALTQEKQHYQCDQHHSFDLSRQGILHLVKAHSHKERGDSKEQIDARNRFLNTHAYDPILEGVYTLLKDLDFKTLADCACGEAYYTQQLAQRFPKQFFYGFDLSKEALKLAKKQNNLQYVIANIKDIPLMDHSVDLALSMFAPIYLSEIKRILKKEAYFIVVSPAQNHLLELKKSLYENVILNHYKDKVDASFTLIKTIAVQTHLSLNQAQIHDLLMMTPYYFTSPKEKVESLLNTPKMELQIDVLIELYQLKS